MYPSSILDDYELFKEQRSFSSSDLAEISMFLNNLLFNTLWAGKELSISSHCQSLLTVLYSRDCKRHFCSEDHWHIK